MPFSHLSDHSETASRSRVQLVREGLDGPILDRPIWIRAAKLRIAELEGHGSLFGLETFEEEELRELQTLIESVSHPLQNVY